MLFPEVGLSRCFDPFLFHESKNLVGHCASLKGAER